MVELDQVLAHAVGLDTSAGVTLTASGTRVTSRAW
jgi:hypothetical protein